MQLPTYNVEASEDALTFEFDSVSATKVIRKVVAYDQLPDHPFIYNLSLGDKRPDGTVDDMVRSNNDDLEKVMATVVQTLFLFFERYPGCIVYFKGSTEARTRLYQIILAKELNEAQRWFVIEGFTGSEVESFIPNKLYKAFLVRFKK